MDTLHEDLRSFMIICRLILVRTRNFSKKKLLEKIKTNIFCSVIPPPENRAVCEVMWKNMVEADRPQTALRRKRIACWTLKATNTHP
jgi:hypothetical protein